MKKLFSCQFGRLFLIMAVIQIGAISAKARDRIRIVGFSQELNWDQTVSDNFRFHFDYFAPILNFTGAGGAVASVSAEKRLIIRIGHCARPKPVWNGNHPKLK